MLNTMILLLSYLALGTVNANTVGHFRGAYPVIEHDIRAVIYNRLNAMEKSGEMAIKKQEMIKRVEKQLERPRPTLLSTTTEPHIFYVDPSITINQDIYSEKGDFIAKKGTVINPFDRITFKKVLVFFNADDQKQVEWVKNNYAKYQHVKFILTGGSVKEASQLFGNVYFDLQAGLSQKLALQHVPSVVEQQDRQWRITEVGIQ